MLILLIIDMYFYMLFICRVHVAQEVHVNIWEEGRHLEPGVALIVVLMATGLVIAKPGTGKTSAIAVEKEAI